MFCFLKAAILNISFSFPYVPRGRPIVEDCLHARRRPVAVTHDTFPVQVVFSAQVRMVYSINMSCFTRGRFYLFLSWSPPPVFLQRV
jgi:hypothetical protein